MPKIGSAKQLISFGLIGSINTGFSFSIYLLLIYLEMPYAFANLTSTVLGILFSFKTNGRFVFNNSDPRLLVRFVSTWACIYLLNITAIAIFMHLGADAYYGGALALPPTILIAFWAQKRFVFGKVFDPKIED